MPCWYGTGKSASSGIALRRENRCTMATSRGRPSASFSSNGRMRDELLDEMLFMSLPHARVEIASWEEDYNRERPHSSLGYAIPAAFAAELDKQ